MVRKAPPSDDDKRHQIPCPRCGGTGKISKPVRRQDAVVTRFKKGQAT